MAEGKDILYEVRDKVAIITLNLPRGLNALNNDQYLLLGLLVERADKDPNTIITFLRSTGRYFSAGANVKDLNLGDKSTDTSDVNETDYWLSKFTSRNAYLTTVFHDHSKVLVAALNGPVVGLSSAIVALCDFVYAMNDKVFLLTPFANLGLVSEGAAASTLVQRLGLSLANEALLLSRPISAERLYQQGFLNKIYNLNDTDKFNDLVLEEFWQKVKDLDPDSVRDIKKIIKSNYIKELQTTNAQEIIAGMYKFREHRPQKRFAQVARKERNHKL
jgi:peroxisomal 3,2-trans-enoyl-CoA isomerase